MYHKFLHLHRIYQYDKLGLHVFLVITSLCYLERIYMYMYNAVNVYNYSLWHFQYVCKVGESGQVKQRMTMDCDASWFGWDDLWHIYYENGLMICGGHRCISVVLLHWRLERFWHEDTSKQYVNSLMLHKQRSACTCCISVVFLIYPDWFLLVYTLFTKRYEDGYEQMIMYDQ